MVKMATSLTGSAVVEKIRSQVSRTWMGGTSEGFECGEMDATVTGIATAWTPTIEALQKAIPLKRHLIISMEPPLRSSSEAPKIAGQRRGMIGT
jgi:putative NIF3 family GTP cyclohydrolase 1 type 2